MTQWIRRNWRGPNVGHQDLWFAMAVARWINWPDTLQAIGFPIPWRPKAIINILKARRGADQKVWTGAYMIGTQGNAKDKPAFIIDDVLDPLWQKRKLVRPREGDSLHHFASRIVSIKNQGRFMVGQIIADIKYDPDGPLWMASDWHTWALSGPGSRRGLNRVYSRDKDTSWPEAEWHDHLMILAAAIAPMLKPYAIELHAQDLQNCLCEFDKYERVKLGEGRPRSTYPGAV